MNCDCIDYTLHFQDKNNVPVICINPATRCFRINWGLYGISMSFRCQLHPVTNHGANELDLNMAIVAYVLET